MTDHEPFQREPQNPQDPQVVVFSPELLKLADRRRQALEDCRQAAEDGDANAVVQMGMNCLYGIGGAAKDPGKAFRWFSQTAPDDPAGLYWLGVCYDNGFGVEQDEDRACRLYQESAAGDYAPALCNLGVCYESGQGVEKNLEKAKYWYSRAALQEEEESVEKCRKFGISVTEKYKPDLSNVPHWHFELQQPAADHLLKLVLEGKKRATSSSLAAYRSEGEAVPKPGDWNVLTNWEGKPGCLIVTTQVEILPFREIGFELAAWEGEDECLESWRKNHIAFFTEEGKQLGYSFSEEMPVVFERFEVLETL